MIAVDTNVLLYFHLPGPWHAAAEALWGRDPQWVAPLLWRSEFRNALTGTVRRGDLSFEEACSYQEKAEAQMTEHQHDVDSRTVLALTSACNCSAYDCEFVALARHFGVKLVTMDGQLLKSFPDDAVALAA